MKQQIKFLSFVFILVSITATAQNKFFEKKIKIKNSISTAITNGIELTDGYLLLLHSNDSPNVSPYKSSYSLAKCNEFGDTIKTIKFKNDTFDVWPLLFKKNAAGDKAIMVARSIFKYKVNGNQDNYLIYAQIDLKTLTFDSYHINLLKHDSLSTFNISNAYLSDSNNIIINGVEYIADNLGFFYPINRLFYLSCNSHAVVNYITKLHDIEDRSISANDIIKTSSGDFLTWCCYVKNDTYGRGICIYKMDKNGKVKSFKNYVLNITGMQSAINQSQSGGTILLSGYYTKQDSIDITSGNSMFFNLVMDEDGDTLLTKKYNLGNLYITCREAMAYKATVNLVFDKMFFCSENGDSIRFEKLRTRLVPNTNQAIATADDGILLLGSYNSTGYIAKTSIFGSFNSVANTLKPNYFSIYPNPSKSQLTIELPRSNATYNLTVTDLTGKQVAQETINTTGTQYQFHRRGIAAGIYIFTLTDTQGGQHSAKVVFE